MGFSEPEESGISGCLSSVHAACEPVIPWENLMNEISSVIPDGESLNTGERNGLWKKLSDENKKHSFGTLINVWCAAHRSNLAYKDGKNR